MLTKFSEFFVFQKEIPHQDRLGTTVGSEEAHKVTLVITSVRRSHCTCGFAACSVHEEAVFRDAKEGINAIRLTNPYSR